MRHILLITICLVFTNSIVGQLSKYKFGQELFVNTKSGVLLRSDISDRTSYITKIKFGEVVKFLEDTESFENIENRVGTWIKVSYNQFHGYVFSGYISLTKPLFFSTQLYDCNSSEYIRNWINSNIEFDSIVNSGHIVKSDYPDPERGIWQIKWKQFKNGNMKTEIMGYEYYNYIYETYQNLENDILNMLDYYISKRRELCKNKDYYFEPSIVFEREFDNRINSIECYELGDLRIEFIDKKIIIEIRYEM